MKCYLVRKEKFRFIRDKLVKENIEFIEEHSNFHVLIIPLSGSLDNYYKDGREFELMDEEQIKSIIPNGSTFKIDATRGLIDKFAQYFIEKGMKVNLENPDLVIEIKKWKNKYLVNVS